MALVLAKQVCWLRAVPRLSGYEACTNTNPNWLTISEATISTCTIVNRA